MNYWFTQVVKTSHFFTSISDDLINLIFDNSSSYRSFAKLKLQALLLLSDIRNLLASKRFCLAKGVPRAAILWKVLLGIRSKLIHSVNFETCFTIFANLRLILSNSATITFTFSATFQEIWRIVFPPTHSTYTGDTP